MKVSELRELLDKFPGEVEIYGMDDHLGAMPIDGVHLASELDGTGDISQEVPVIVMANAYLLENSKINPGWLMRCLICKRIHESKADRVRGVHLRCLERTIKGKSLAYDSENATPDFEFNWNTMDVIGKKETETRSDMIGDREVSIYKLNIPHRYTYVHPEGFAWGFEGDAPRELAYHILWLYSNDTTFAENHAKDFMRQYTGEIVHGRDELLIPGRDIIRFIREKKSPYA
jgi:hypothetical protein